MRFWQTTVLCILGIEVLGALSGWLTASSIGGWYATLEKPPGTPPDGVFGPVWTLLYAMMAVALARVLHARAADGGKRRAAAWFAGQLALNLAWTPVFFGLQRPGAALAVIALLLAAVAVTIHRFRRIDPPAALLMLPYFLWTGYAAYLNAGFAWLNR